MDREKIRNMDFQEFKKVLPSMEGVHYLKADGTEVYGVYKHDVCYVERDGVKRTLQMIVPEMKPDKSYVYPAILYVQGSAWMKQDVYAKIPMLARLAEKGYVIAVAEYRHSGQAPFPAQALDARNAVRFMRKNSRNYKISSRAFFRGFLRRSYGNVCRNPSG